MSAMLNNDVLDAIFRKARGHDGWLGQPASDQQLRDIYDLMKWGPTLRFPRILSR